MFLELPTVHDPRAHRWAVTLAFTVSLAACGTTSPAPPEVDVSGVWHGTWTGVADQGFTLFELDQQPDGEVSGSMYLRADFPLTANKACEVTGRTEGRTLHLTALGSSDPHQFTATIAGESMAGQVDYRGNRGTWQAGRLPSRQLVRVSSYPLAGVGDIRSMTMAEGDLIVLGSGISRLCPTSGALTTITLPPPEPNLPSIICQGGIAYDTTSLLCTGGTPPVQRFALDGSRVDGSFALDDGSEPGTIVYDGAAFWDSPGIDHTMRRFDSAGHVLTKLEVKVPARDLAWFEGRVAMLSTVPATVVTVDAMGQIVEALRIPRELTGRVSQETLVVDGLAASGDRLWVGGLAFDASVAPPAVRASAHELRVEGP